MIRVQFFLVCLACGGSAWAARTPKIYNALISSDENLSPSQAYPIVEPVLRTTAVGVTPFAQPLFQPVVVHPQPQLQEQPRQAQQALQEDVVLKKTPIQKTPIQKTETPANIQKLQTHPQHTHILSYNDGYSLYPVAYDPYFQYGYHRDYIYSPLPPLPFYQQPVYVDYGATLQRANPKPQPQQLQLQQEIQNPETPIENKPQPEQIEANPRPVVPVLPPLQAAPSHLNFKKNPDIPDVIPPLPFTLRKERKQSSS